MNFEKFKPSLNLQEMLSEAGLSGGDQALLVGVLGLYATVFLTVSVAFVAALGMQGMNSSEH